MSIYTCGLLLNQDFSVPGRPDGGASEYFVVPFPYDEVDTGGGYETGDSWGMHQPEQPDGSVVTDWFSDPRSGLIWPHVTGWATLQAMVQWTSNGQSRDGFVRDPLGINDTTCAENQTRYGAKFWQIMVYPGTPLALRVRNLESATRKIGHAQFKLSINTDVVFAPDDRPLTTSTSEVAR